MTITTNAGWALISIYVVCISFGMAYLYLFTDKKNKKKIKQK